MKYNESSSDKEMLNQMDYLSEFIYNDDIELDVLECEIYKEDDEIDMKKIKEQTFKKVNLQKPKKKWSNINKVAAILLLTAAVGTFALTDVSAQIQKLFQYIPGVNRMVEVDEAGGLLVLERPIKKEHIELISVVADNGNDTITVAARGTGSSPDDITAKLPDGAVLDFPMRCIAGGTNIWDGDYSTEDKIDINLNTEDTLIIRMDDVEIPVALVETDKVIDPIELGTTAVVNDTKITAIKDIVGDDLTIHLFSPEKEGQRIDEYALPPDYEQEDYSFKGILNEKITLKDEAGNLVSGSGLGSYSPPLSEFHFDISDVAGEKLTLEIPYLKMNYFTDMTVDIKLPDVGEKIKYDKFDIEAGEFWISIQGVERTRADEVMIDFDVHYDEEVSESLYEVSFTPDLRGLFNKEEYNGYSLEYVGDEDLILGEIDKLYVMLNYEDLDVLPLHIDDFTTVIRGPWRFEIDLQQ